MDLGLNERACIVTGASRGIGRATATALASEGASVLLIGRNRQTLEPVARACADAGGRATPLVLDVTDPSAGESIVEACINSFGRIDALVNNAGTSAVRPLQDLTDDDWQTQWELHVMAPMRLMREAAPAMADRKWGRIVNVCSSSGKRPSQTNVAYSVTKAAELSLSRAFADAFAAKGVLVNAVAPGPVGSELWLAPGGLADQMAQARGITREEALEAAAARVPIGRLGQEREIAAVIVFLCSAAASNVAGAAWSVDGGTVPVII
jgi:3-oxoacyl-[acyl-carrier protein] reductase